MEEIYKRHHKKLYNFLVKLSGNPNLSEDMLQDTFIRSFRYASTYRAEAKLVTWLFSIARNVCNDYWRKQSVYLEANGIHIDEAEDHTVDPAYIEELQDDSRRLQLALLKLPEAQREIVLLAKLKELSIHELSQLFECSQGAIRIRLHRALKDLAHVYSEDTENTNLMRKQNEL